MNKPITEHEGKKYLRKIYSPVNQQSIEVDVYAVLEAFNITSQPIGHAIKKLLACGQRGKGDVIADLHGVLAAVNRAIDQEMIRQNPIEDAPPQNLSQEDRTRQSKEFWLGKVGMVETDQSGSVSAEELQKLAEKVEQYKTGRALYLPQEIVLNVAEVERLQRFERDMREAQNQLLIMQKTILETLKKTNHPLGGIL